jgi:hypothetical protein
LECVKGLEEQIKWTLENDPNAINDLALMVSHILARFLCCCSPPSELERASSRGCSDDCGSLRENGLKYIPRIEGIPDLDAHVKKERRGFLHHATARLLCPRHLRDYFDDDRERFCRQILEGLLVITHDDWPSFLFPNDAYNPDNIDEYMLRSPFMLAVHLLLALGHSLIFSVVLSPSVHWAAHRFERNPRKIIWKKVHRGSIRHTGGDTSNPCICRGFGKYFPTLYLQLTTYVSSVATYSTQRRAGLLPTAQASKLRDSITTSSTYSTTTMHGPRKHWIGGMSASQYNLHISLR